MKHALIWIICLLVLPAYLAAQVIDGRASTVAEGWARGASDIIRSRGEANLSNSQAAINAQDAYSMAIQNSVDSVNAYWERKKINAQERAEKRYERSAARRRYADSRRLQPLAASEFDRTTGQINWPGPLKQSQYSKYREDFDAIFKKRAKEGWLGSEEYLHAADVSREWRDMMKHQQGEYPREVLVDMVRFVLKLDRELNENLG